LGVNVVSKALESDLLEAVIIDKDVDPQIITKILVPIAHNRQVPIVSVSGLNVAFGKACGIRCIALGFKVNIT
jgi:ribosomal protein L7Ae-like RNA K-turn-binding protein